MLEKYKKYSSSAMQQAYEAVKKKRVAIRRAAVQHGVPESSLRDKLSGRTEMDAKPGHPQVFDNEREQILADHCIYMAKIGYGYTAWQVVELANSMKNEGEK